MNIQEIKKIQVGNLIMVNDQVAVVDTIARYNENGTWVRCYEGHYKAFEKMEGEIPGWVFTTDENINKQWNYTSLENVKPLPIPANFEKLNQINLYNDPMAVSIYQYVHLYQNEYNKVEDCKEDWVIE